MITCDNCKGRNPATTCPIGDSLVNMFGLRLDPSKYNPDKLNGAKVDLCFKCSKELQERVLAILEPVLIKGGFYT